MASERSGIVTPEAVLLEFQTAGVGSRAVARAIDLFVQLIAIMVIFTVLSLAVSAASSFIGETATVIAVVAIIVGTFLVFVGYYVLFDTLWHGRTPGKALVGLRIVTNEGAPIRFRHAAVRELIGIVELFLLAFVAVLSTVLSRRNQRIGDMAGGTIVLRERHAAATSTSVSYPPPPGLDDYVRSLDVTSVTNEQYRVIRSYLLRVKQLRPPIRISLSIDLANPVAVGMRHEPPAWLSAEVFLVCVASAFQIRHGGPGNVWSAPGWVGYGLPPGWGFPPGYNGLVPAPPAPAWGEAPPAASPGWGPSPAGGWGQPPPGPAYSGPPGPAPAAHPFPPRPNEAARPPAGPPANQGWGPPPTP